MQALRQKPDSTELGLEYEKSLLHQLEVWPDATSSDEAQAWLADWLIAQQRRVEFVQALLGRISRCQDSAAARRGLAKWLEELLRLTDREQQRLQMEAMQSTTAACQQPEIASCMALHHSVARAFSDWMLPEQAKALQSELASAMSPAQDDSNQQLVLAAQLLFAIRSQEIQQAERLSKNWQPHQLPASLRNVLTVAYVAAVDEAPITQHRVWLQLLKVDQAWIDSLQDSPLPLERACGLRFTAWLQNASQGLQGIADLSAEFPRDGGLQMLLSQSLAASGANRLDDSSRIAKRVAASSPPASELNLAARWRLIRNDILAGNPQAAQQAAQLLLTTLPAENSVWRQRLQAIQLKPDN